MRRVPRWVANRAWWAGFLALWALLVGLSLRAHLVDTRAHFLDLALGSARNIFRMVVLVRAWNSGHGGVYVPVSETTRPNPYLEHPLRDVKTHDGRELTLVNPAFMTRQLGEMAAAQGGVVFHITSRRPIRPANRPDAWEDAALRRFEEGDSEVWAVLGGGQEERQLRYMAPLRVTQACLACHEKQGYREGDIRGGISVTQPYGAIEAAGARVVRQGWLTHGAVFVLVAFAGFLLLEALRRRWLGLAGTIGELETARSALLEANRALGVARDGAEAASRAKSAFLANISHELRTPMNAITGFAYLLRRGSEDPKQQELASGIETAASGLQKSIDEILDLARLEAGTAIPERKSFSPRELAEVVVEGIRRELALAGRPAECRLEVDDAVPGRGLGDAGRIAEILAHFGGNAVKFSQVGEVVLRVRCENITESAVRLRFEVEDQGIGISPEQVAGLFQPFFQVDGERTRRYGGSGVGLVLCRRLAQLLGGEVGVRSRLGEGSCFWFEVPVELDRGGALGIPVTPAGDEARESLRRLLLEDDPRAVRYWRENEAALRGVLGPRAALVAQAVEGCDFAEALRRLEALPGV